MFYDYIFNKIQIMIALLAVVLSACAPVVAPAPTETTILKVVSPTPVLTSTLIPITATPSPLPTQPIIPFITPDSIQVERWKEYETALGDIYLKGEPSVLCEWEILGQTNQEVYVWVVCRSSISVLVTTEGKIIYSGFDIPAVIHLGTDGAVQNVEIPGGGTQYASDIRKMFPSYAQDRYFGKLIDFKRLSDHIEWRRTHPEEPPLIILSASPTP